MRIEEMEKLPKDHPDHISYDKKDEKTGEVNPNLVYPSDEEAEEQFKVGQKVLITGGKHKKLIKEDEVCIIQEVRKTFLVVQVSGPESLDGRTIQCHRKFITSFKEEVAEPNPDPIPELDNGGVEMPTIDDCVIVNQLPDEDDPRSSNITAEINEVKEEPPKNSLSEEQMNDKDEIVRLKGVISDLEADIVSYRDMMLGHQNELEYLRRETGPTVEEKKKSNEKIIECIKILLSLQ